jgi:hypothetical protein
LIAEDKVKLRVLDWRPIVLQPQGALHSDVQEESATKNAADDTPDAGQAALSSQEIPTATQFQGGTLEFFADRVTLCGVVVCGSGRRHRSRRIVLELLSRCRKDGAFVAFSGENLEADAKSHGAKGTAAGWIRDLRNDIMESLRNKAGIVSGPKDIILSGGTGYRFTDRLTVQFVDEPAITDITDTGGESDVPEDDVRDALDVPDNAVTRRDWILQQLADGVELKGPMVAKQFTCSVKTAVRDLTTLKDEGKINYVGTPRTGHYRLCSAPASNP